MKSADTRVQGMTDSLEVLSGLWDCYRHAVMVVDDRLALHFANRSAEALLKAGSPWASHDGKLKLVGNGLHSRLTSAIGKLVAGHQLAFSLFPPGGRHNVLPIVTLFLVDADRVAVVITDAIIDSRDFRFGLERRFGLTPAEADVINSLVGGWSLREIADRREIRYETARSQLKNAMQKNGWQRQGQLISEVLVTLLPPGMFTPYRNDSHAA